MQTVQITKKFLVSSTNYCTLSKVNKKFLVRTMLDFTVWFL